MVKRDGGQIMTRLTLIQCHFVRGMLNHRIRFGTPDKIIKLDKYRKLACYEKGRILGYIRWRANEFGTQDWRFYILKTESSGVLTRVPGVSPAVKLLAFFNGPQSVKRALKAFDKVEAETEGGVNNLSESYWMTFQNDLGARNSIAAHRRNIAQTGVSHAR